MRAWLARWRWVGLGVCAMLGLAAVGWTVRRPVVERLRHHPYFVINHVAIHGVGPALTPDDVTAWLGLTDTTTVWEATPASVRERLEAHPFISAAAVKRDLPRPPRDRRPRAPAAGHRRARRPLLRRPQRRDLRAAAPGDPRNLPVITGLDADAPEGTRNWMLRRALRLLRRCERSASPSACVGPLSEVHVDPDDGLVVFPASPRVPLVLGWGSWHTKLERAERALRGWQGRRSSWRGSISASATRWSPPCGRPRRRRRPRGCPSAGTG